MNVFYRQTFALSDPILANRYQYLSSKLLRNRSGATALSPDRILATGLVTLIVAVFCLLTTIGPKSGFQIVGHEGFDSYFPAPFSSGKRAFLDSIYFKQNNKSNVEIAYVAKIISSNSKNDAPANLLAQSIVSISKELKYDPLLVAAVIKYESTFHNKAVSPVGAIGLMQIMPTTGEYISRKTSLRWSGKEQLYNSEYNIRLGISYLKYLEQYFSGNRQLVLIAYNWGPGNLQEALKNKSRIPSSPIQYASKILRDHQSWSGQYALVNKGDRDAA